MRKLHIITPVKNSPETTRRTIRHILSGMTGLNSHYTIYNDFSSDTFTSELGELSRKDHFELVNLSDITEHPSPNYLLILQKAQAKAKAENADLLIVESDVLVKENTFVEMLSALENLSKPGMIAAVTTDENGKINFPYLFARRFKKGAVKTKKRLSFCCTLLSNEYLNAFDFQELDPEKNWYDVFITVKSYQLGFNNYILTSHQVVHLPHSSRPWKNLKYTNPLKYYWEKFTQKRDRI
jgi:hypothetical protein